MVKLADLVHIANNAKTNAQKNAVGEQVKKLLRGEKACNPKQELFSNAGLKIEKGKMLRKIGAGEYGVVFYGCLEDKCNTKIALKVTSEPTARMEYRIAEKLRGMGVPRMYHFKKCGNRKIDTLYFEYVKGESLEKWMQRGQSADAYRSLISQLIKNLKRIHEKYPTFRHHDLHWNNILVLKGNKPIMIDFGLSTIEGIKNPDVANGGYKNSGIYPRSHYMYDVQYIFNIIYNNTNSLKVKEFIRNVIPEKYLDFTNPYIKKRRLRADVAHNLPTYDQILNHPFLQPKKRGSILRAILPKKKVMTPKPQPKVVAKPATGSAIRRAKAVLEKEAAKKKIPPKRPGIAKRDPSVMNQVRSIERKIATEKKVVTPKPKLRVFINKNGDLKIEKKKCRLYKKEDLVKMFKLDPKMTKEQMCKFIKNM
ncbi:serine/threonine protein kinase [Ostreococcus tauri virus 2]|uniref:serine/threonine protein kinase n=1 Tax=Ostreococcus tauri virus 2 TaxID=696472 RepID=UPI0001EF4660|nr:serine/threonine protein kinase [Ostreococcus tauri virus 2]CBI70134.1 serine/threonine protein kinase [Ostreococcus tauri virus 2]